MLHGGLGELESTISRHPIPLGESALQETGGGRAAIGRHVPWALRAAMSPACEPLERGALLTTERLPPNIGWAEMRKCGTDGASSGRKTTLRAL